MAIPGSSLPTGRTPRARPVAPQGEPVSARLRARLTALISRSAPVAGDHRLTIRNIYVLPTRQGLALALVLLIMLACAINYGLALGYALSFLVFSIALIGLLHTFRNLSALRLRAGRAEPAYAGSSFDIGVQILNAGSLERFAIGIDVPGMSRTEWVDLRGDSEATARIALPAGRRGWAPLPRLCLSTRYPLGIWRAWTYWQPARSVLVYPQPENAGPPLPSTFDDNGDGQGLGAEDEDLAGVRPFRPGDEPRRIAWTAMARTASDEILSKQFEGATAGELLLDFDQLPSGLDTEARLSRLTRWVLDAEHRGIRYGLALRETRLEADHGARHMSRCLEALALFGTAREMRPARMDAR